MSTKRIPVAVQLLTIPALVIATACSDQASPTAPSSAVSAAASGAALAARPPRQDVVSITSLTINPTSLTIGGSSFPGTQATWTATIENPKKQALSVVYVQTYFTVYNLDGSINARKAAGGGLIQCPGRSAGVVPGGTCTITGTATPSNSVAGGGTLIPDDNTHDAKFEIELLQDAGGATLKTLTKRAVDVTLFYQLS